MLWDRSQSSLHLWHGDGMGCTSCGAENYSISLVALQDKLAKLSQNLWRAPRNALACLVSLVLSAPFLRS